MHCSRRVGLVSGPRLQGRPTTVAMLAVLLLLAVPTAPAGQPYACSASPPVMKHRGGQPAADLYAPNASACATACCKSSWIANNVETPCVAWDWDSNLTADQVASHPDCAAHGPPFSCCWLRSTRGEVDDAPACVGTPHCESWSGTITQSDPGGFHNGGSPSWHAGEPVDCEWRRHAWEFAKTTLPSRGEFRSVFDALQLHVCGVAVPAEHDVFKPPTFPTPPGRVWHIDAAAAAAGADGSKAKPYATLEAGIAAAGSVAPGSKALLLRAGTYHTPGVVLQRKPTPAW